METALQQNQNSCSIETAYCEMPTFSKTKSLSRAIEKEAKKGNGLRSLAYFIWVYVAIFSGILAAVIIAENLFFQY